MAGLRGNKTLAGTWGEVWVDGEKVFVLQKIEQKAQRKTDDGGKQNGQQGPFCAAGFLVDGQAGGGAGPVKQGKDSHTDSCFRRPSMGGQQRKKLSLI